jgi:mono/diheme cytochrome c family protein
MLARANSARCHAIGAADSSPNPEASAFRTLRLRYPVESLGKALAEGIAVGHPGMPQFELQDRQIADLTAFLKSLQPLGRLARPTKVRSRRMPFRKRGRAPSSPLGFLNAGAWQPALEPSG